MKKIFVILFLCIAGIASAQPFGWTATPTAHGVIIGNGNNPVNWTGAGATGSLLVSGGNTADPNWLTQGTNGYILVSSGSGSNPTWKAMGNTLPLQNDTLTTGQALVGTPYQFNAADTQSTYKFRISGFDTSSSAAGIQVGFAIPSGATIKASLKAQTTAATALTCDVIKAGATASVAIATTINLNNGWFEIEGTVKTGSTAGAVILQFLKVTSGTGGILNGTTLTWSKV